MIMIDLDKSCQGQLTICGELSLFRQRLMHLISTQKLAVGSSGSMLVEISLCLFALSFVSADYGLIADELNVELASAFNVSHNKSSFFKLSHTNHLNIIKESIRNFANRTLVVCVVVREPFVIYNEPPAALRANFARLDPKKELDNYSGVAIEIIKRLRTIFKFNIRITRPADNQFGAYLRNESRWTGLMGSLVSRRADIGVTGLSITLQRAQAIEFTRAYYVETAAIMLRRPAEIQNYLAIFEPFSSTVWLLLLISILLLIFLITVMMKLEEEQRQQKRVHESLQADLRHLEQVGGGGGGGEGEESSERVRGSMDEKLARQRQLSVQLKKKYSTLWESGGDLRLSGQSRFQWLDRFYYAVACVINILLIRDIKNPPRQTPIRILVCFWWLSSIVIVNIYLGILFGQLVLPRQTRNIETLEELVNQNEIRWSVTEGSAISELFRQSNGSTIYGQLGERMSLVGTADDGVSRVVEQNWAYIREKSLLTFKMAQEHHRLRQCKLQFAREEFYSVGFGLGLVKRSVYLDAINSALTLMIENGFVSRWQTKYWPKRNQYTECKLKATDDGQPLTMKHFISIYLVCLCITGVSLLVLIYQHIQKQSSQFFSQQ